MNVDCKPEGSVGDGDFCEWGDNDQTIQVNISIPYAPVPAGAFFVAQNFPTFAFCRDLLRSIANNKHICPVNEKQNQLDTHRFRSKTQT